MVKVNGFEIKEDLYYWKKNGTWVKIEPDGNARIGIADVIAKSFPTVNFVKPLAKGSVKQGDKIALINVVKTTAAVETPVSGEIVQINEVRRPKAKIVKDDPYGEGWIALIKPSNLEEDLKSLVKGYSAEALEWYKSEVEKRKKKK